ncbi:MAG: hypothetical protein KAS75_05130 [Planctomycetes bacterium]|nr:hypothetical protein [Planctomycetota bacterium]
MSFKKKFTTKINAMLILVIISTVALSSYAAEQQTTDPAVDIATAETVEPNTKAVERNIETIAPSAKAVEPNIKLIEHDQQGNLFSISIDNAEIKDVLESLAAQADLSLVLPEDIKGKVTLRLKKVTLQTALDSVLQAGGYAATEKDDVLFVYDSDKTFATETFKLNFANAKDIETTISKILSTGGKVGVDERLNSIVVSDTEANLKRIRRTIMGLDVKADQVMIEVLIVNVKLTDQLKMGIDWTKLGTATDFYSQGLSATTGANPFGKITFSSTSSNWNLVGLLDFVETNKNVKILANPKVLVLNNHTATIDSIEEIPYQELSESSAGGSIGTTSFKEAGIKLEVTPQITNDGYIIMNIKPEQSARTDTLSVEGSDIPVIETRKTNTTLRVMDGQTIIIGGLRKSELSTQESKVPILGDIPILGVLFRKVSTEVIESELGVFITPHIYTDGKLSAKESELLEQDKENEPIYQISDLLRLKSKN